MGQKQRILIARAVLPQSWIHSFDEATNSLDANNESIILKTWQFLLKKQNSVGGGTPVEHCKNADQIIVL